MDTWRDAFGDLLLGSRCAGCDAPGRRLCRSCAAGMRAQPRLAWPDPVPETLCVPPYAAAAYEGALQQLIVAYKEEARFGLARPLGRMLADTLDHVCAASDIGHRSLGLVPVPSRRKAVRSRGHDHVLRMARVSAALLRGRGLDATVQPLLRQGRGVHDQAGLSAPERARNLDGALVVRAGVSVPRRLGSALVVVDDVITTGTSAAAAVTALRLAGHRVVAVATVAATPRRWPSAATAHG